jgi:predicted amidophosphoribosyltransferase
MKKGKRNSIVKKEDEILKRMTGEIEAKAFYCPNCGSELKKEKYCPECKKKLS